jgi:sugar phosphate isomerase/epimerase
MLISIFTQSLFAFDLKRAIEVAGEVGFDGIEIACQKPHLTLAQAQHERRIIMSFIQSAGLAVSALSTYTNFTELSAAKQSRKDLMSFTRLASEFETEMIKFTPGPPSSVHASRKDWETLERELEPCVKLAEKQKVKLAVETHLNMLTDTTLSTMRLVDMFDSPAVGVNLDFCNVFLGGDAPDESILQIQDKVYFTHVKDVDTDVSNRYWTPLGQGKLNYPGIIKALTEIGYNGYLSIECLYDKINDRPREAIENDLRYLARLLHANAAANY